MSLYNADGQINLTVVNGLSYTGLYAANGSWNVVINNGSTYTGYYHPCGAINSVVVSNPSSGSYASNGSMNVISNAFGGYSPVTSLGSVWNPSAFASTAAPAGYHWAFVTFNGARVISNSVPVVALVGN